MAEFIYVDYSNLFITARYVSGSRKRASGEAEHRGADQAYHIDFNRLYGFLAGPKLNTVGRCALFSSRTDANQSIWQYAEMAGFEVFVFDRNAVGEEKKVDTALVAHMMRDAYTIVKAAEDTITLVTSDSDFVPAVELLVRDGFNVQACSWKWYSTEIQAAVKRFIPLDEHLGLFDHQHNTAYPTARPINTLGAAFDAMAKQQEFAWTKT